MHQNMDFRHVQSSQQTLLQQNSPAVNWWGYLFTTTILQPFYAPMDFVRDYPDETVPENGKNRKLKQSGFTGPRDSEWQLGHMQICTSPQTHNNPRIPVLSFLQVGCLPAIQPTVSKKTERNRRNVQAI